MDGDPMVVMAAPPEADRLLAAAWEHHRGRRPAEAEALARRALALRPDDPQIWNARGVILRAGGQVEAAIQCFRRALEIAPNGPGAWSNLGNAFKDRKHVESAIACHRRAVALDPANADYRHNLGIALTAAGRHGEALDSFERAIERGTASPKLVLDRGIANLHLGKLERGWPDYEARLEAGQIARRAVPGRRWQGEDYRGRTLLIVSDQGFGDTIWVARYLAAVKARGGTLILECHAELIPLIASLGIVDRIVPRLAGLPAADLHCYLCSLPGLFTPSLQAIPPAPYLPVPPQRGDRLAAAMAQAGRRLKVGIVWSGRPTFAANADRAAPLSHFLRAFSLPGVQLYSLQKGPPTAEFAAVPGAPVIDLDPLLDDFTDTAAALGLLDLVIMTDSAVAHLGGALGRPVWVLLHFVPYWLWLSQRSDSPWYPSLRLFRQPGWGDWDAVFDAAGAALLDRAARIG